MAEIYVQSSEALSDVIQELTTLDQQFMDQVSALDREQANLVQAWEGEASDAFQERYRRERDYFCAFATVVTEYINGLARILSTYEQAEASNVAIAGDGAGAAIGNGLNMVGQALEGFNIQMKYGAPMPFSDLHSGIASAGGGVGQAFENWVNQNNGSTGHSGGSFSSGGGHVGGGSGGGGGHSW